jgi:hypothetical protein
LNTYAAGDGELGAPTSREWVFGALATPGYRERCDQLAELDLRRRPGCEPCLQSLVTDQWTPDTLHHLGWCESCRSAAIALGPAVNAAAKPHRRRALWLAVAAGALILVPLAGSQLVDDPFSSQHVRGGVAQAVKAPNVVPVARSKGAGATKSAGGAAVVGVKASAGSAAIVGVKASAGGKAVVGTKSVVGGKAVVGAKPAQHKASPSAKQGKTALPLTT